MRNNFSVTYKTQHNQNKTLGQNFVRDVHFKCFETIEQAKDFARNVQVLSIIDKCGNKIKF
jgi:hypothetical protein